MIDPYIIFQYVVLAVLSFLGVFAGIGLAYIAPEELKDGEIYFKSMFLVIVAFVIYHLFSKTDFNRFAIIVPLVIVVMFFLYHLVKYQIKHEKFILLSRIFYVFLGIAFFFVFFYLERYYGISLIMLAGFPIGSIIASQYVKNHSLQKGSFRKIIRDVFMNYVWFFVPVILLLVSKIIFF